jgi:hypothetical protein
MPERSEFPWKIVAIILLILVALLAVRWIFSIVWWLAGTVIFVAVVVAIVWALMTVTRKR